MASMISIISMYIYRHKQTYKLDRIKAKAIAIKETLAGVYIEEMETTKLLNKFKPISKDMD
jgi:hypothetical protein